MRSDMCKVLVERPRRKGLVNSARSRRFNRSAVFKTAEDPERFDEPESLEKIRPSWWRANRKELNENLEPLWRFLKSREGQPWDKVYSEIRKNLDPKSAVQMHVVQHLKGMVSLNTFLGEDGKVYETPHYRSRSEGYVCLENPTIYRYRFYVHPVTHLFCVSPLEAKKIRKKKPQTKFQLGPLRQYRLINGEWYVVEFAMISKKEGKPGGDSSGNLYRGSFMERVLDYSDVVDVLYPQGAPNYTRENEYGYVNLRAISIRPLGKREAKHIKTLLSTP